jgi:hypothetical protein
MRESKLPITTPEPLFWFVSLFYNYLRTTLNASEFCPVLLEAVVLSAS